MPVGVTSSVRFKYVKGKKQSEDEEDEVEAQESDDEDNQKPEKGSKVIKVGVNSLRVDLIVKSGLGIARK